MPDMLQDGVTWLAGKLKAYVSQSVTYSRPGSGSVVIVATPGQTMFRTGDDRVSRVEWSDADFIVTAADLVLASAVVVPKTGDRITWGAKVFEVQPTNGEQVYRNHDEYGITLRIHTKRVG